MLNKPITVRQLNTYVKGLIEGDSKLNYISVTGEISNFKNHFSSGHWYFTLKDNYSAVRAMMFKAANINSSFVPKDGDLVVVTGRVSLYEKDGQYQFYAEKIEKAGKGDALLKLKMLKEKLANEGLFDIEHKKDIPKFPQKIAVITSAYGAAVKDIINIVSRRYPLCELIISSVSVQGRSSKIEMLEAIKNLSKQNDLDLIIITRGGGSAEDLQYFNSEALARLIFKSDIPIISAVGHETDFTICDLAADLRAPTPSAAAELAVPDREELKLQIDNLRKMLLSALSIKFNASKSSYNIENNALKAAFRSLYSDKSSKLSILLSSLDALNPVKIMNRGFAVALKNNKAVNTISDLDIGDNISLRLADGIANCSVISKKEGNI